MKTVNWIVTIFTVLFVGFMAFGVPSIFQSATCTDNPVSLEAGWNIDTYNVDLQLQPNGDLRVSEKIDVTFDTYKHGIYRIVPLLYKPLGEGFNANNFSAMRIDGLRVTQDGNPAIYESSRRWGNTCTSNVWEQDFNKELFVKIGDPDRVITGPHTYQIDYVVHDALRNDRGAVELYWNGIGNGWGVPITQANITLSTPDNLKFTGTAYCYAGLYGENNRSCVIEGTSDTSLVAQTTELQPQEGFTVLARLTPENMATVTGNIGGTPEHTRELIVSRSFLLIPLLALIFAWYIRRRHGSNPQTRGIIAPRFDAPGDISPAQAGVIVDQKVDTVDIASIIINIARKGYMTITENKSGLLDLGRDYVFAKTTPKVKALPLSEEEKYMLYKIFEDGDTEVKLSSLKYQFSSVIQSIHTDLYSWAVKNKYLKSTPSIFSPLILPIYAFYAVAIVLGIFAFNSLIYYIVLAISGFLAMGAILTFKFYTKEGKELQEEVLGLKMYISTAEKDRIEFHNAPEKTPALFEKLLPYAMALGVTEIWAKSFEDLHLEPPEWYHSSSGFNNFNAVTFASSLTHASQEFSSVMTSVKSSSSSSGGGGGGGFSGGGGGGGGGGSW